VTVVIVGGAIAIWVEAAGSPVSHFPVLSVYAFEPLALIALYITFAWPLGLMPPGGTQEIANAQALPSISPAGSPRRQPRLPSTRPAEAQFWGQVQVLAPAQDLVFWERDGAPPKKRPCAEHEFGNYHMYRQLGPTATPPGPGWVWFRAAAPRSARVLARTRVGVPGQAEGPDARARLAVAQGWEPLRESEHGLGSQHASSARRTDK
jgi:hypothetical protein